MGNPSRPQAAKLASPRPVRARSESSTPNRAMEQAEAAANNVSPVMRTAGRRIGGLATRAETAKALEELARDAAEYGYNTVRPAYQTPDMRNAALEAARMALGLIPAAIEEVSASDTVREELQ